MKQTFYSFYPQKQIRANKKTQKRSPSEVKGFSFSILWYQTFGEVFPQKKKQKLVKFNTRKKSKFPKKIFNFWFKRNNEIICWKKNHWT